MAQQQFTQQQRRPTPAAFTKPLAARNARNKPLPPASLQESDDDGEAYENAVDTNEAEDYLEPVRTVNGSIVNESADKTPNATIAATAADETEYDYPDPEYNDVVCSSDGYSSGSVSSSCNGRRTSMPLPPPPYLQSISGGHSTKTSGNLAKNGSAQQEPKPKPISSSLQAVMPPGLNTIKEVRNRLRPSLTNVVASDAATSSSPSIASGNLVAAVTSSVADPHEMSVGDRRKLFEYGKRGGGRGSSVNGMKKISVESGTVPRAGPVTAKRSQSTSSVECSATANDVTGLTASAQHTDRTDDELSRQSWFIGNATQQHCQQRLTALSHIEGEFVVRRSQNPQHPFALLVLRETEIFTIPVRKKANNSYALGSEKPNEAEFDSVMSLVRYHREKPIFLVAGDGGTGRKSTGGYVTLRSAADGRGASGCVYDDIRNYS